jgi:hypothetical protein
VNQSDGGSEQQLAQLYRYHVNDLKRQDSYNDSLYFTQFDFHENVKGNNYDSLTILMGVLDDSFSRIQFFLSDLKEGTEIISQNGTFRINCIGKFFLFC